MDRPIPRQDVYDLYWYFAAERQRIFEQRSCGVPGPWTQDEILSTFKFCNVFRAADRVSQYLIRDVAYAEDAADARDTIFRIIAFRLFSRIETWRTVNEYLGRGPQIGDLRSGRFAAALEHAKREQQALYTGAFILCAADAYDQGGVKYLNHVELLRHMFVLGDLAARVLEARSLRTVVEMLREYPLIGDFMSYQIAIDLNYSEHLRFSENEFTVPGPGAMRGIRKVFVSLGSLSASEIVMWMIQQQEQEFAIRGLGFRGLWGRPLHAIDCQGLFCEVDKYCREAMPGLRSARRRIKARFRPSGETLELFFPPRWGINEKIPSATMTSRPQVPYASVASAAYRRASRAGARTPWASGH